MSRLPFLVLLACVVLAGCSQAMPSIGGSAPQEGRSGPKRVVAAIQDDPHTVFQKLNPASRVRGVDALEFLVDSGLTVLGADGGRRAVIAEAVPTAENGLWKVFSDGTMETTWKIKPGVQWHDGVPFTSDDLLFTLEVARDADLAIFRENGYAFLADAAAPDPATITVRWKQPYIDADTLFSSSLALPIAKHSLEQAYREKVAETDFIGNSYWSTDFVGTGPFKLKDWERSSHLTVAANDKYVLGRPQLDEIEVRFISDANTLMANVLAGSVEVIIGRSLSGPQAVQVRDTWTEGRMAVSYDNWLAQYPQFINPTPAIIANLQFRRAAVEAINRQQLADVLLPGQSAVADSWLYPNQPLYKDIEAREVTHYPYDPRQAAQMLEGLGYTRGADGILRDSSGQKLTVEARTTAGDDLREKMIYSIIDDWKAVGIESTTNIVPRQLADDLEYRATFPSFELVRNPNDLRGIASLHSRNTAGPENQFRVTGNRSRYQSPELDSLVDKYLVTIPMQERLQVLSQIVRHISQNLNIMGIIYNSSPTLISNRLINVSGGGGGGGSANQTWNAHEWDVR
jgi:peptide/nickel transport system substrate-binding protein